VTVPHPVSSAHDSRPRTASRLGILGGTFDPIHLGHVAVARAAVAALQLDEVRLVPSFLPPHRAQPSASPHHRFAMAALTAIAEPRWTVSDVEVARDGPSYTFDTLSAVVAAGVAPSQIFFLLGADAFAEIATWARYPAVLDLAHFVVVSRPGTPLAALEARVPELAARFTPLADVGHSAATAIVPLAAATPDVSSTGIRARAARGGALDGLVTEPVERYIRRHGLYGARPDW
jgi:nicotinate-nucleotide adenylyltransferase